MFTLRDSMIILQLYEALEYFEQTCSQHGVQSTQILAFLRRRKFL